MTMMNMIGALNSALRLEMNRDPDVLMLGVDLRTGIFGVSAGLHEEFGEKRVIDTPMTEILKTPELKAIRQKFVEGHMLRRAGQPEEVAAAALFLVSDDASFVSGHALTVDGGYTAGKRLTDPPS